MGEASGDVFSLDGFRFSSHIVFSKKSFTSFSFCWELSVFLQKVLLFFSVCFFICFCFPQVFEKNPFSSFRMFFFFFASFSFLWTVFCRMFFFKERFFFMKNGLGGVRARVSVTPPKLCDVKRFGKGARSLTLPKRFHDA